MALRCPVLMNSCLALSMKQSTLKASGDEQRIRENAAIHYHQKAIKALSMLLADPQCASRCGFGFKHYPFDVRTQLASRGRSS